MTNEAYLNQILEGDCLQLMPELEKGSIDMILCDLPYAVSRNKWDTIIDPEQMWAEYKRILKPNGVVVLTANQPFTSLLVMSNPEWFKLERIWEKTVGSGQLNIKHQPLRMHESVLIFYNKTPTYHPQLTQGEPYSITRKVNFEGAGYGKQAESSLKNEGVRQPTTIMKFPNPRIKGGHPTQKPVALFEDLILTYTNEGDTVLDNCIGSGTTAVAAKNTNRNFIGMEMNPEYVNMARSRVSD